MTKEYENFYERRVAVNNTFPGNSIGMHPALIQSIDHYQYSFVDLAYTRVVVVVQYSHTYTLVVVAAAVVVAESLGKGTQGVELHNTRGFVVVAEAVDIHALSRKKYW